MSAEKLAIEMMGGLKPVNPIGSCFDSAGLNLISFGDRAVKLCHGIGIANFPGQVGLEIAHAWLEVGDRAFDCIWAVSQDRKTYRENFNLSYLAEYTKQEALILWEESNHPGPWDKKIIEIVERNRA